MLYAVSCYLRLCYNGTECICFLVMPQRISDVTINQSNQVTYSFLTFNWDLRAYTYMCQRIHDTKMSWINTCTILFDIFSYWWDLCLGGSWYTSFCTTNNHLLHRYKGTCNSAPLPYLDEDSETNYDMQIVSLFFVFVWLKASVRHSLVLPTP